MWGWLAYLGVGFDRLALWWYSFWSGFGSDLGEFALAGGIVGLVRKHNCETHWCPRLGRHEWQDPTTGQRHKLCRKHHPLGHLTAQGIRETHDAANAQPSSAGDQTS